MGKVVETELPTYGRLGHLTPEQTETLKTFKDEITKEGLYKEERHDDHIFLRFLRARKFNLVQSKKMFEEYEKWRIDFGVDELMKDFDFPELPSVRKFYPRFYHKTDRFGRPVYIEKLGMLDVKQLLAVTTMEKMIRHHVYEYEKLVNYRLKACSIKAQSYLEQSTTILDLKGVSISAFSSVFSMVKQVSSIAQNYYPEMLGKMFIINSPMLFTGCWAIIKPLLDEATVKKIDILGSSYNKKLLELIPEENLPTFLGGTSELTDSETGPWNDGTVPGYPKPEFETLTSKYG